MEWGNANSCPKQGQSVSAEGALKDRAFSEGVREVEGWDEESRSGMRLEDILGKVCISLTLSGAQLGTNTTQHREEGRSSTRTLTLECFTPNSNCSSLLSFSSSPPPVLPSTLLQCVTVGMRRTTDSAWMLKNKYHKQPWYWSSNLNWPLEHLYNNCGVHENLGLLQIYIQVMLYSLNHFFF